MPPSAGVDASQDEGKKLASSPSQHTDADEKETCDALCSLMGVANESACPTFASYSSDCSSHEPKRKGSKACPKQLQLPMFLSSKFHQRRQKPRNGTTGAHRFVFSATFLTLE